MKTFGIRLFLCDVRFVIFVRFSLVSLFIGLITFDRITFSFTLLTLLALSFSLTLLELQVTVLLSGGNSSRFIVIFGLPADDTALSTFGLLLLVDKTPLVGIVAPIPYKIHFKAHYMNSSPLKNVRWHLFLRKGGFRIAIWSGKLTN